MPATVLGQSNAFVPSHMATKRLTVDFSRNVKDFGINRYIQIVPVDQMLFYYARMDVEEAGRIVNANDHRWPGGNPRPSGNASQREFQFIAGRTERFSYEFSLDSDGLRQATLPLLEAHTAAQAQQVMTERTLEICTMFTTEANHDTGHVIDVSALSGVTGTWAQSTTQRQTLHRCLAAAVEKLLDATLGKISVDDLRLVINSEMAKDLRISQEVVDYIKGSPEALSALKGDLRASNPNAEHGLPKKLYNVEIVVEKTRTVSNKRGGTRTVVPALGRSTPFLTARPGSLEGVAGAPSFSGGTLFVFEDMKVETFNDKKNRRTEGYITDNRKPIMTAPAATVMFKNA